MDGGSVGFEESSDFIDGFVGRRSDDWRNRWVGESGEDAFDGGEIGHGSGPFLGVVVSIVY